MTTTTEQISWFPLSSSHNTHAKYVRTYGYGR